MGLALWAVLLGAAGSAQAGIGEQWRKDFEFDGEGSTAGKFGTVGAIAIDQADGIVYVVDRSKGVIGRFDLAGNPEPFPATGESSLDPYPDPGVQGFTPSESYGRHDLTVDSYGSHPGRIYVSYNEEGEGSVLPVRAFEASGELVSDCDLEVDLGVRGLTVDVDGGLWLGDWEHESAEAYGSDTCPPEPLAEIPLGTLGKQFVDELGCDASGNLYVAFRGALRTLRKHEQVCATRKADLNPTSMLSEVNDIAIDQSSADGHIFALRSQLSEFGFAELTTEGDLLGEEFGSEDIAFGAERIAHYAHPSNDKEDRIFVANGNIVTVFEKVEVVTPDVTLDPVSEYGGSTAKFSGTVNPLGVNNQYQFEWKRSDQAWVEAESSPAAVLPAEDKEFAVSHEATSLPPGAIFNVRLVAENTDLKVKEISAEHSFSNIPPTIDTVGAAPRTQTTARLNARVYSSANPASVRFEFSEDEGASWQVLPEHQVPEGATTAVVVGEEVEGLVPGATYHFRALAENDELGPASPQGEIRSFVTRSPAEGEEVDPPTCPNASLRASQHTTYLGSCRAIELVNTPEKGNQSVGADRMRFDGNRALWNTGGGSPGGNSGSGDVFLAKRTPPGWDPVTDPNGWVSRTLIPPPSQQVGGGDSSYSIRLADPSLSCFLFEISRNEQGPVLARLREGGEQDLLRAYATPVAGIQTAMSDDCSQVLALDRETAPEQLEEIGDGTIEVVSVMPDGSPSQCGVKAESAGFTGSPMVSAETSRVYFRTSPNGSCAAPRGLYVRDREAEASTLIALGTGANDVDFVSTSDDGQLAYFTTHGKCLRHNQASGACEESEPADVNGHRDVYRWDEAQGGSSCITCIVPDADVDVSKGDVLVSGDFSHVYFQSKRRLLPGKGKVGSLNLYVLSGEALRFVAEMGGQGALGQGTLLSADGNLLAFKADPNPSLTADPIAAQCPSADVGGGPGPCSQLYLYDDRDESLECVSCARDRETAAAANLESGFRMSTDGSTIAFASAETLDPANDINGDSDLYEWRMGAQRLLTDGQSGFPTKFAAPRVIAIDAGGQSVYFGVVAPGLTGFERDGLGNVYSARIGGGFPVPSPQGQCEGDSCQGPLVAPPPSDRPPSSSFQGTGNVKPSKGRRPCARKRGKAKRRCIKKRRARARAKHRRARLRAGVPAEDRTKR